MDQKTWVIFRNSYIWSHLAKKKRNTSFQSKNGKYGNPACTLVRPRVVLSDSSKPVMTLWLRSLPNPHSEGGAKQEVIIFFCGVFHFREGVTPAWSIFEKRCWRGNWRRSSAIRDLGHFFISSCPVDDVVLDLKIRAVQLAPKVLIGLPGPAPKQAISDDWRVFLFLAAG